MFIITQKEEIKKDLKIIINFRKSHFNEIVELYSDLAVCCSISDLISQNIVHEGNSILLKRDILLSDSLLKYKSLLISLITSLFNNTQINYSEDNYKILHEISIIFGIQKLKISIERYESYLDQLNQFELGRLPLIDEEFLCQHYLLDLTKDNLEDTLNASLRFISTLTSDSYGQIMYRCIFSQLSKSELFLSFIVNELPDFVHHFIRTLMRNYRFFSFSNAVSDYNLPVVCYLLRYFVENGYLKRSDEESFNYSEGWRTYTYQFFDFDDGYIHYESTYYVFRHYDEISKDNYSLHRKLVLNGKNQEPLFQIVEKDDLDSLQKLLAFDPSKSIDTTIEKCYYESRPLFQYKSYSLLEIAAFFGSIKIFKFLLINNATIRKNELREMALYGGNSEIIRLCQQHDIAFDVKFGNLNEFNVQTDAPILIAIKMHNFKLLRWLIEDNEIDIKYSPFDPISYALRCSNFLAFYYLLRVKYQDSNHDENLNENQCENLNEKIEVKLNWYDYLVSLVLSHNIPIIENYVDIKDQNLLELPIDTSFRENKFFFEILVINYDTKLIDLFLKNNKILNLKDVPYEYISSLTYQRIGRYFLTNKNVTYTSLFLTNLIKDLIRDTSYENETTEREQSNERPTYNMKLTPEFIEEQIQLLFEKALSIIDKIFLLPAIFKYNLYENHYSNLYREILTTDDDNIKFKGIERSIFVSFIEYTNIDVLSFLFKRIDKKNKKNLRNSHYILSRIIGLNKFDTLLYLLSSEESPFSSSFTFDEDSFFDHIYRCTSVEILQKLIKIFNDKNKECNFYNDVFLPNAMFHIFECRKEIIKYILDLPEIEPFINKENEKFNNLPPLLYSIRFIPLNIEWLKLFISSNKVDINIRQKETQSNILAFTSEYDILILLFSNDNFKCTSEDITKCFEKSHYPGACQLKSYELLINNFVFNTDKFEFTDEQLSRIFNKLCILDDRVELAKRFYSKFSERINVNYVDQESRSFCLLDAIDCDCVKMVEFLLTIPDIDLNIRANTGSVNSHMNYTENITPFCFAVVCGIDEIIQLFIKRRNEFNINETFSDEIFF